MQGWVRSHARPKAESAGVLWWTLLGAIVAVAVFVRLYPNALVPGWDVDESTYEKNAENFARGLGIRLKAEYIQAKAPLYTSHPPFGFIIEGWWFKLFGSGITQARWLAVTGSIVTIVLLAMLLRRLVGNGWSLIAALLIATDGWMTFTNRVGWLENVQLVFAAAALWLYWWVSKKRAVSDSGATTGSWAYFKRPASREWRVAYGWLFLAGLALAGVFAYKQVGAYILLAAMIHRVVTRHYRPRLPRPQGTWARRWLVYCWRAAKAVGRTIPRVLFGPLSLATGLVMSAYIAGMTIWAGQEFFQSTLNQIKRALGLVESRGAVKSSSDIITPLVNQYKIYVGMLFVLALAGLMVGWQLMRMVVPGGFWRNLWDGRFGRLFRFSLAPLNHPKADTLLFVWTLAAFMVFGGAKLWLPHYVFMVVLPAYCYVVSRLRQWYWGTTSKLQPWLIGLLSVALVASGLYASYNRLVVHRDNAVYATVRWMDEHADHHSRVIADEFMGQQIPQPYCKISHAQLCEQKGGGAPDYLILYTTTTQQLPRSAALQRMVDNSDEVFRTSGFKETITIKRTKRVPAG
jgi:4-amino-4-deoxy-L-arabinose transferase-like glycosyltransferase